MSPGTTMGGVPPSALVFSLERQEWSLSIPFLKFDRKNQLRSWLNMKVHFSCLGVGFWKEPSLEVAETALLRTRLMRAGALVALPDSESFSVWDPNYCHFLCWCTSDHPGRPLPPLQDVISTIYRSSFRSSPVICLDFKHGGRTILEDAQAVVWLFGARLPPGGEKRTPRYCEIKSDLFCFLFLWGENGSLSVWLAQIKTGGVF